MSKIKLITDVTVEIDAGDTVGEFPLKVKKITKKEKKPYDKFVKEQELKHKEVTKKAKKRAGIAEDIEELQEDIEDVSLQIESEEAKETKLALVAERRELRAELRKKKAEFEKLTTELEKFDGDLEELVEAAEKMFFSLRVLDNEHRAALEKFMDEYGLRYGEVLTEINRLMKEANKKK